MNNFNAAQLILENPELNIFEMLEMAYQRGKDNTIEEVKQFFISGADDYLNFYEELERIRNK